MWRCLLLCLVLWSAACTPARRRAEGNIVRKVQFEGNGALLSGQNDYQLRSQMKQSSSGFGVLTFPLMYAVAPVLLRPELLPEDAYRLEVWYAHRGWLDARVQGWELRKVRDPHPKRAGVLDVRGVVEPGEPSMVRSLRIEGLSKVLEAVSRAVLRNASIREGDQFDLELAEQTRALLLDKLRNQAHAYASAELVVSAFPEDHVVDVVLTADVGPVCRVGPITVTGNKTIPTVLILQRLAIEEGDGYKLGEIQKTQRLLFEMGTFSIVTVKPDLSDPSVTDVPIQISVTESKFRSLRVGVGASYDGFLFEPRVTTRVRHVNLLHSLMRAEFGARAGLAYDVTGGDLNTRLPTYGVEASLSYPRIAQQRVAIELSGEYEQDIYSGLWAFRRPRADLAVVWKASPDVQVRAGPHAEQFTFLSDFGGSLEDPRRVQNAAARLFGIEGRDDFTYQLTSFDAAATFDYRDDPQRTRRGSYRSVGLRQAVPLSDAGYLFSRISGEYRTWVPLKAKRRFLPLVLAFKARGTVLLPYDGRSIPVPERAYLGGANSLRGFRPNQAGPYVTLCTVEEYQTGGGLFGRPLEDQERVQLFHLPEGGNLAAETTFEVRYDWIYGISLATFTDVGVLTEVLSVDRLQEGFRASFGVGARYQTLVGPLRVDLSFRPTYPEDDGPLRYAGADQCDPDDLQPRVHDFFSNFPGLRGDSHPPFAMVFYLTLGEAF